MFRTKTTVGSNNTTVIAEGVKIEGKLFAKGATRINGIVMGSINSENVLTIGKNGKVESNIKAKDVIIAGSFKGKLTASGEVEITSSGRFVGDLIQKGGHFSINRGGLFSGRCIIEDSEDEMASAADDRKKASTSKGKVLALKKQAS